MMKRNGNPATMYWFAFLGMLFWAACTTPVRIMPLVGASAYPPTDPASVMVMQTSPLRPHETLGHIVLEPENALSIEETERMLREAAAGMGAHAVVILANMKMEAGANSLQTSGGHVVSAVAIRYTDQDPHDKRPLLSPLTPGAG
jgi:hypothetical protein